MSVCNDEDVAHLPRSSILWPVASLIVLVSIVALAVSCTFGLVEGVSRKYALWQAEEMLSLFLANHPGELPHDWQDLSNAFECTNETYNVSGLSSIQARVAIDFVKLQAAATRTRVSVKQPEVPLILRYKTKRSSGRSAVTAEELRINKRLMDSMQAALEDN